MWACINKYISIRMCTAHISWCTRGSWDILSETICLTFFLFKLIISQHDDMNLANPSRENYYIKSLLHLVRQQFLNTRSESFCLNHSPVFLTTASVPRWSESWPSLIHMCFAISLGSFLKHGSHKISDNFLKAN